MGTHQSSSTCYGMLYTEEYIASSQYLASPFAPTIYSFDLDDYGAPILQTMEVVSTGTPMPYTRPGKTKISFLSTSDSGTIGIRYYWNYSLYYHSQTISAGTVPAFDDAVNPFFRSYLSLDTPYSTPAYLGSFRNSSTGKFYILGSVTTLPPEAGLPEGFRHFVAEVTDDDYPLTKQDIISLFWNGSSEEVTIKRTNPKSQYFKQGQSSILQYELVNFNGETISTNPSELLVSPGDGWTYDVSTRMLTYNTGIMGTHVTVRFIHNGEEYEKTEALVRSPETYAPGGNTSGTGPGAGGNGSFGNGNFGMPENSDPVGDDIPKGSVESDLPDSGFFTRYLCTSESLTMFSKWLWSSELGLSIAKGFVSLLYGSPAEAVISLMSYPFDIKSLNVATGTSNIYWGCHKSNVESLTISSSACTIDWGSIQLDEYWGNFLDYSPHTKIELYLPWGTGFVQIDPGQVLPGTIRVTTNIDLLKGSCVHNVVGYSNTGNVSNNVMIGSYMGQCGKLLPMIGNDYSAKALGTIIGAASAVAIPAATAIGGAINGVATGVSQRGVTTGWVPSPHGPWFKKAGSGLHSPVYKTLESIGEGGIKGFREGARPAGKLASTSLAILKTPATISRNGGFGDASSSLSIQYPYITLSRPIQSVPAGYGAHYGYPSNILARLYDLTGYTEIGEIHLENIPATATELDELDRLLKGGVIF